MSANKNILYEIELCCNNYFNPANDPNSSARNYPESFLELAGRIEEYIKNTDKSNIANETAGGYSVSTDLEYSAWQKAFARELSIYKRIRVL